MTSDYAKEWALRWTEGTVLVLARKRIEINRALGMLERALQFGVKNEELFAIIENIKKKSYLPFINDDKD